MKEILYCLIVVLICVMIYRKTIDVNLFFVAIALIILVLHASRFTYKIKENFEISTVFEDAGYKEPMVKDANHFDWQKYLTVYISSLNKDFINFEENLIHNVVNKENIAAIVIDDLKEIKGSNNFEQSKGFKIANEIYGPSPVLAINNSFNNFSFFWYMKFNVGKTEFENGYTNTHSLIRFNSKNLSGPRSNRNRFFEIRVKFHNGNLNPDISVLLLGTEIAKYTYTSEDYFTKWFCDGNYHLICFTKDDSDIKVYMDNHVLIESQMPDSLYTSEYSEGETQLQLDKIIKLNDETENTKKMKFNMISFGIVSEYALSVKDVSDLNMYYKRIQRNLSPDFLELKNENTRLKHQIKEYTKPCPFKNQTICDTPECSGISDWSDYNQILSDSKCFKHLSAYCNTVSVSNIKDNKICNFLKSDNIMKMASTIDSNLFHYNAENIKTNIENKKILQDLQRLGLKDIYLDKSFRNDDGSTSSEMNRLINDLLNTNQTIDLNTLDALHRSQDKKNEDLYDPIDYNRILENDSFSNDSEFEKLYNKMLSEKSQEATINSVNLSKPSSQDMSVDSPLIDLNYDDATKPNVYDHILKKHKEKSLMNATNSWGIFDIFKQ
jgi:hypothetical protein